MAWFSGTNDDKGKYIVRLKQLLVPAIMTLVAISFSAIAEELRLLTWGGYAPEEVVSLFEKETGIVVQVTLSNNEDMISKLRTTYYVQRATCYRRVRL
jgi:spermidine/putrescine transport system substrate-binding protein